MAAVVASTQLLSARFAVSDARPLVARRAATAPTAAVPRSLTVTAGWFDNNKDVGGRDAMWEKQQEILRKRKGGNNVETEVQARRKKVSGFMKGTLGKEETEAIKKVNRDKANALSKEAFKGKGFLPIPGMAIGMPEFDGGERFDLRAPYADEGWVDEETKQADAKARKQQKGAGKKAEPAKKKGWFGR